MSGEVEVTVDGPNRWDLDRALKRFEREVAKSGVLSQAKARRLPPRALASPTTTDSSLRS